MIIVPHQNAAGSKPVVTSTATGIFDLINTAASTSLPLAGFDPQVDSIDITPEDGNVRVLYDGNTPTASNGQLLYEDVTYHFRGVDLLKFKLIRTAGSNVTCNAVLGRAISGEITSSGGNSVSGSGGGGGGGAVTVADGADIALGETIATAASSDDGAFSLIALIKRGLQGITTLIALLPAALGAGGGLKVDGSGTSLPVTASAGTNLNTSALALESGGNLANIATSIGSKYITGIAHGSKTVTTAGTDVALAGSTSCKRVTIEAYELNTGRIAVGGSGVDATQANGSGLTLGSKDTVTFDIDNLADVFIDSTVNGEGVRFTYFT